MTPALLIVATLCTRPLLPAGGNATAPAVEERSRAESPSPAKATQEDAEGEQPRRDAMPPDDLASLVIASALGGVMLTTLAVAVARQIPQPCTASLGCLAAP